jgi:Sap, sulfolipid-1-addressing protein
LALTASIYPPAVAAVIALGRGPQLRSRVAAFVIAAAAITYATGILILYVLSELGATGSHHRTPSAAIELVLGVALVLLAVRLRRPRPQSPTSSGTRKIDRYLRSRRLAFVLGITLYILPSPIYIGAVKSIADAELSTSSELLALVVVVVVMLWLIELPMLMLFAFPARASGALAAINLWFGQHGREVAVLASAAAGIYLAIKGFVDLVN